MYMNNYENMILDAVQTIVDNAVSNATFDKTIQGTVKKVVDETIGKYIIKYQDSAFFAYSTNTNTTYPVGSLVYVLIPNNDMEREKTILGSVNKLGIDYVNNITEEEKYNKIGTNIIKSNNNFELCSYKKLDYKELYNREKNINLLNLNEYDASLYLKNTNYLLCGANFKTLLSQKQKFKGNYGISFELLYIDNATGEDIIRTYTIDIDNMIGNPYSFDSYTKQYGIYQIDGKNFKSVEKISIFSENFPYEEDNKPNDIFVNNIFLYGAEAFTSDELANCALSFITPQGIYFDNQSLNTDSRTIQAEVRIKGKVVDVNSQSIKYYWFRENASINKNNIKYNKFGGNGWECLNPYSIITENENQFAQWNTNIYQISILKSNVISKENRYKCVAVYNDSTTITKEIIIYNFDSEYNITISSSNGINFYFDTGKTELTCLINGEEKIESNYSYSWGVIDYSGLFTILEEKTNKLKNVFAKDIINSSIYKCTVYRDEQFLGTSSIVLYNYLESDSQLYHLILNNSVQVYKYNEYGISPASLSLDNPINIMPLNFILYDSNGEEIPSTSISSESIQWKIPKTDTMISIPDSYGEPNSSTEDYDIYKGILELGYQINPTYNINYKNNNIELSIDYDGNTYVATTNFIFIKEGEMGTNGTEFVCKIVPNTSDINFHDYPCVIYNEETETYVLNYNNKNIWFLVQLWKNGEKIFEGNTSGVSLDGQDIKINWSNLINKYSNSIKDNTNFIINNKTGEIEFDSTVYENPANIIKCEVEYLNNIYISTIPITLVRIKNNNFNLSLKEDSGFREVIYNTNGKNPKYNNLKPFELKVLENIDNVFTDISISEDNYQVYYNWEVKGNVYIDGWKEENNLLEQIIRKGQKNQKKYSPIDNYNGMCLSNALYCSIVRQGEQLASIHIPIQFYLNRYGNSLINQWDGNSISIKDDEGIILSPQVGAGKKENDNSFTGVFMGSVQEHADQDIESGLFGYDHGERTFLLDAENGMASFGKSGAGQIIIDPSTGSAILKSGNYDEDKKIGMIIDLSKPNIKYANGNFSVDENGKLSAKELSTISENVNEIKENVEVLDKSTKKFTVSSGTNTILIPVDENHYPLENQNYAIEIFSKYMGENVTPTVNFDKIIPGITRNYRNNILTFSVKNDTPIEEVSNILTATFNYINSNNIELQDVQQYNISLAIKGSQGVQGVPGIDGENGQTSYFHVKYAPVINPSLDQMTEIPDKFIGTYVDFVREDSVNPADYTWSKFQGEDGIPGINGENGQTSYLHIKYSNDGGKTFTTNNGKDVGTYIGQYTDFKQEDSNNVSDYKWALIKGADGESSYTFFRYSPNSNGSNMTSVPQADSKYIGVTVVSVNQAPTNPSKYTWSLIKGEDGTSPFIAQLTNENHTFAYGSTKEVTTQLIGYYGNTEIEVTLLTVNGVQVSTVYKDTGVKGLSFKVDSISAKNRPIITFKPDENLEKGINEQIPITYRLGQNLLVYTSIFSATSTVPGNNGQNAKILNISSTGQVFTWDLEQKIYLPQNIRLTPVLQGNISYSNWKYSINNGTDWNDLTSSLEGITINTNGELFISNNSFITDSDYSNYSLRCYSNEDAIFDTVSIIKLKDGKGILTTEITYQIGDSGINKPVGNWSSTIPQAQQGKYLWTKVLTTYNDNTTSESYSVSYFGINGTNGIDGENGNGIASTKIEYQEGSSGTVKPTGNWNTSIPSVSKGKYLWTKITIRYTNNTTSESYSVSYSGTNGIDGIGIKSSIIEYQQSSSGTQKPTGNWTESIPAVEKGKYLWTRTTIKYTDDSESISYNVSYMGINGIDGQPGAAGKGISSTKIEYQKSNNGIDIPEGEWLKSIPVVNPGEYLWTRTIFSYTDDTKETMYSIAKQGDTGNGILSTEITYQISISGVTEPTGVWLPSVPEIPNGQYLWTKTYIEYTNGEATTSYSVSYKGIDGENGISPYNVILTNESQTIAGTTTSAKPTSISTNVLGYQGTTKINTKIGTITGVPNGMTFTISNNNSQNTYITFSITSNMTSPNGQIIIPVTVGNTTINKIFSYSVSFTGLTGEASREYYIEPDNNIIIKGADNKLTPSTITFKSYYTTGISTEKNEYNGTWWIQYTTDGEIWNDIISPSAINSISKTITVTKEMRQIKAYLGPANTIPTASNVLDIQTIPILIDVDNISIGGRNYLIKNNWITGNWDLASGELNAEYEGRLAYLDYVEVIPGETYCTQLINNKDTVHNILCRTYDENKIKVGSIAPMQTIYTIPDNVKYLTFTIYDNVELNDITSNLLLPKFEKGNKPTDWTPAPEDLEDLVVENSIISIENQYCYGNSLTIAPAENDKGWTSNTPIATEEKKYMWARIKYVYSNNKIVYASYSCLATENKYLKDQITEYILSSNNKNAPAENENWVEIKPNNYISSTPYLWMRTKAIYSYENSFLNDEIIYCDYRLDTSWNTMFDLNQVLQEQVQKMVSSLNGIVKISGDTIMIGNDKDNPTDVIVMNTSGIIFYKNTHSGWPTSSDLDSVTATLTIDGKFNANTIQVNDLTANNISNQNLILGKDGVQGQLVVNNFKGNPILEVEESTFKVYKYDNISGIYKGYVLISSEGFQEYNEGDQLIFGNNGDNIFYGEKIETEELIIKNSNETNEIHFIPVEITIDSVLHKGVGII